MSPFAPLRLLNTMHFTSGAVLAERLGVSRASISLALHRAPELGVAVESVHGQGYRLLHDISWLDEQSVARELGSAARYFDLKRFEQIDSTNSALLAAAQQGAPSGMVYAAEHQTRGRGRLGRPWHGSLGGSLMASLLWRFPLGIGQLSGLSLAIGVAILRALRELGCAQAALKWPNDILAPDASGQLAKLGGILIEVAGDALGPSAVVIGMGINIRQPPPQSPHLAATSLETLGHTIDRNTLLARILRALADVLPLFEREGFSALHAEWEAAHAYQQQRVSLLRPDGTSSQGIALGVAANGALRLADETGEYHVHAGELSLRPVLP